MLLALALPSCIADPEPAAEPPLTTIAASERANALGVTTWEIRPAGDDFRIVGRDGESKRQAEMTVHIDDATPDRVQVESMFPERGAFDLSRNGTIEGAASERLQQLGTAVIADLGEHTTPLTPAPGEGLGVVVSAEFLQGEGHISLGWSLFGYRWDGDVNGWCLQGTRTRFDAYSNSGASCWVNRWTSDSQSDCRINLHYGISGGRSDTCNWFVYMAPQQ